MPRGRPTGAKTKRKITKQESPTQVIDEKVVGLLAILANCANEHFFSYNRLDDDDCNYCPVQKLCHRVWNNSGYKGIEDKFNVVMKLKHRETVSDEMMKLIDPYQHNKEKPRKGVKNAVEAKRSTKRRTGTKT